MLGCKTVGFQWAIGTALCAVIAAGTFACASSTAPPSGSALSPEEVVDVFVESLEGASRVTLVGPDAPVFTAFQSSGPDRVVVDLANVVPGEFVEAISVDDGLIKEVRVEALADGSDEAMTRVEVWLSQPVDFEVVPGMDGLAISLVAVDAMAAAGEEEALDWSDQGEALADDPWTSPMDEGSDTAMADADAEPEGAGWKAAPATVLSSVDAQSLGEGSMIHLQANGSVDSAVSFTLEDPSRLVIDLPDMTSEVVSQEIPVGSAQVSRVRIGTHADKVRVVVDGGSAEAPFDGRQVVPVASGLVVALGSDPALDDAVAAIMAMAPVQVIAAVDGVEETVEVEQTVEVSQTEDAVLAAEVDDAVEVAEAEIEEEAAWTELDETDEIVEEVMPEELAEAPAPQIGNVRIYGVEFDAQPDRSRVVVIGEGKVDYLVYEPDPGTVVLSIANAEIAPEAAVRIAPESAGPVSLVTAFEQPDVETPEVRVVIKRASNLKPEVTREGSLLVMDFPNTGKMASAPPVYDGSAPGMAMEDGTADTELAMDEPLPMEALPMEEAVAPAAIAPEGDFAMSLPAMPAEPASTTPPAAIEILNEGGLMDGKEYVGRRISLDFKEVDIADVLRLIAEVSDLNVIAGDEVSGKVTIRLVDVPWDQALDVILLTKGLGFARIGNVLRIAASDVLAQEEELRLQERRAKEKLEDLVVKLQPVNYADVKDVSGMVKQLLTERGTVNVDTRTNTLIIKDIASVIDEATALVKAVDTMTPQVMIEAKIVEAGLQYSRELGTKWTFGSNPLTEATLGGRDYVFNQGATNGIADGIGNALVFGNPITANPNGSLGLAATVLKDHFNFEVELQAAEVNGDGKVISSPRVVTLDNSPAVIEQGVSIPFQTFENGDAQIEFVDAVLKLDVTPHITADGSIIMDIKVSRNAPDDSVVTITGSPAIAKNQVETETLVKDGQTLVLGGIYVVDRSERASSVPYLSRLPFLGPLFRSNEFSDDRKELLIFVSPRVVQTPGGEAS